MEIQNLGLEACFNSFLASGQPHNGCGWSSPVEKERQDKTKGDAIYLGISVDFTSHSQQLLILPQGPRLSMARKQAEVWIMLFTELCSV